MIILNWMLAKYRKSPGFGAIMMIMITIMIILRFHENSSNHPKNFTFPFFLDN